jgi:hypothetical protein
MNNLVMAMATRYNVEDLKSLVLFLRRYYKELFYRKAIGDL